MNLSSMYQIIAENNFPEIRQLWTGLTWSIHGYEITEMKIHEDKFNGWEGRKNNIERWSADQYGLKCAIFDYGGLSIMIGFGTILSKVKRVDFKSDREWTDRISEYAKLVGKNPSIVLVDEWLGGKRYRRNFWRWQPIEMGSAKADNSIERTLQYIKAARYHPTLPEGIKNSIRDSLLPNTLI